MYHVPPHSNANLLIGPSETEGAAPEWSRCRSISPATLRFVDVFIAAHHQRLLVEKDPASTFTADQARDWIVRAEVAISEFMSVAPEQRGTFAVQLLDGASTGMTDTGEAAVRP